MPGHPSSVLEHPLPMRPPPQAIDDQNTRAPKNTSRTREHHDPPPSVPPQVSLVPSSTLASKAVMKPKSLLAGHGPVKKTGLSGVKITKKKQQVCAVSEPGVDLLIFTTGEGGS